MSRCRVVWVSTSLETRGGISSFVRSMQQTPLWEAWGIQHVATHRDGSVGVRLVAFVRGAVFVMWTLGARRPDVVHLHTASYGSFARKSLLAWAASAAGSSVIIHVHGGEFHRFFARSPRIVRAYIRATLMRASTVIALGETWAHRLHEIAPLARIMVVPNAVRPGTAVPQPGPGEPVNVLFLGQVSDHKGAFSLIEAWGQLPRTGPAGVNARLVLAGDGALDRARTLVGELGLSDEVEVVGWVSPDRVLGLVRQAQVLALPSRNEGQPMAVLEAMANGLCVVATAVGGLPDLVDEGCGVLVDSSDVPAFAQALRRVITDPAERASLGCNALQRVRERFDVELTWRKLDALYQELAG